MTIEAHAGRIGVRIGEREAEACMVEFSVQPSVRAVAGFALGRETCCHVVWTNCRLEVLYVAGIAFCGEPLKLPGGRAFMTRLAVSIRMSTD